MFVFTHVDVQALLYMVLNVPSAYLGEYAIVLEETFGVKLSVGRISQIFAKHGINRKKVLFNPLFNFELTL